jgi:hypothetical protein
MRAAIVIIAPMMLAAYGTMCWPKVSHAACIASSA